MGQGKEINIMNDFKTSLRKLIKRHTNSANASLESMIDIRRSLALQLDEARITEVLEAYELDRLRMSIETNIPRDGETK